MSFAVDRLTRGDERSPRARGGASAPRREAGRAEAAPAWAAPAIAVPAAEPRMVRRMCAGCEEEQRVSRAAAPGERGGGEEAPAAVRDLLGAGGGSPLSAELRAYFEPRLGRDLGDVRVHTGARADASARAVRAQAYTVGSDVVFRGGAYAPDTGAGRGLLAHELVHVAQSGRAAVDPQGSLPVSSPGDRGEREADRIAGEVLRGAPGAASGAGPGPAAALQRQLEGEELEEMTSSPDEGGLTDDVELIEEVGASAEPLAKRGGRRGPCVRSGRMDHPGIHNFRTFSFRTTHAGQVVGVQLLGRWWGECMTTESYSLALDSAAPLFLQPGVTETRRFVVPTAGRHTLTVTAASEGCPHDMVALATTGFFCVHR